MHLILHWLGIDNVSGYAYAFWSGFGGDVAILGSVLAAPVLLYRKHNCGIRWCWRLARHEYIDPGTDITHQLCRKHHPDHPGRKPVSWRAFQEQHRLYLGKQAGRG